MNRFFMWSARADDDGMFSAYMMANAAMSCLRFFAASVLLTVAMFLPPPNELLMVVWIWWSFCVAVAYCWICSRAA